MVRNSSLNTPNMFEKGELFMDAAEENLKRDLEYQAIIEDINFVLKKHGVYETILRSDVTITEKSVTDLVTQDGKLSRLIIESLWPSIESATVYHYTKTDSAESILNSGVFRLSNIEKRYYEDEILTFCETHELAGYLEEDAEGSPYYRTDLMPSMFYASFTDTNLTPAQEETFWQDFAGGNGVRLKIEIQTVGPNFRKIYYEERAGEPIPLLSELTSCISKRYGRRFTLKGLSTLCAFYLSGESFGHEQELRAFHSSRSGGEVKGEGAASYIELPLVDEYTCGYKLKVVEVHAMSRPNMPDHYAFSKRKA